APHQPNFPDPVMRIVVPGAVGGMAGNAHDLTVDLDDVTVLERCEPRVLLQEHFPPPRVVLPGVAVAQVTLAAIGTVQDPLQPAVVRRPAKIPRHQPLAGWGGRDEGPDDGG